MGQGLERIGFRQEFPHDVPLGQVNIKSDRNSRLGWDMDSLINETCSLAGTMAEAKLDQLRELSESYSEVINGLKKSLNHHADNLQYSGLEDPTRNRVKLDSVHNVVSKLEDLGTNIELLLAYESRFTAEDLAKIRKSACELQRSLREYNSNMRLFDNFTEDNGNNTETIGSGSLIKRRSGED